MDPTKYDWARDEASRSLIPTMLPPSVALAPSEVLEMIPRTSRATQRSVFILMAMTNLHINVFIKKMLKVPGWHPSDY